METLIAITTVLALLYAAAALCGRLIAAKPSAKSSEAMPFKTNRYFLSRCEQSFYGVLKHVVAGQFEVFTKVRLLDVLWLPPQAKNKQRYRNMVQSKHVDFVLCDPKTLVPVLAIELDDSSHNRGDRQRRDILVDQILADAGLAAMRVSAKTAYDARYLSAAISDAVGHRSPKNLSISRDLVQR